MSIDLTDEMRERLSAALAESSPVVAASVDADGQPKLSFYGSTHVHSTTQLAIWVRDPSSSVLERIRHNPRMAFLYRNAAARVGWQFFGQARVVDDPDTREQVYAAIPEIEKLMDAEKKGTAVIVDLDRVTGRGLDMRAE